jgi:hypothetical protein
MIPHNVNQQTEENRPDGIVFKARLGYTFGLEIYLNGRAFAWHAKDPGLYP